MMITKAKLELTSLIYYKNQISFMMTYIRTHLISTLECQPKDQNLNMALPRPDS